MKRMLVLAVLAAGLMGASVRAADGVDLDALTKKAGESLVLVQFTYRNDNMSREEEGQGIVLSKDGVIAISGTFIPEAAPRDFIKDIKVRAPGMEFKQVSATFLGRTTNRLFAFIKTDEPIKTEPLTVDGSAELKLGSEVAAVGLSGKSGGYAPYLGVSRVRTVVPFTHDVAITSSFGLTRATSPVFEVGTGKLVGITLPPVGEALSMTMPSQDGRGMASVNVQVRDEEQSSVFLPWNEVKEIFENVPTKPFESHRPYVGLDSSGIAGVEEDVRKLYKIEQNSGVTIGTLIPGGSAEKAGMQAKDIVLKINGKEFSNSIVPEIMVAQFSRAMEKLKVGDEATFSVLRDGKPLDIKLTVEAAPKMGSEMALKTNAKVGLTTRDLAFFDIYARKLPADTKGVYVVLVKQGAPASQGSTPVRAGYLITKVNDQPVTDEKDFAEEMKKATEDANATEVVFVALLPNGDTQVCRIDLTK